jgi:hypothetical protein
MCGRRSCSRGAVRRWRSRGSRGVDDGGISVVADLDREWCKGVPRLKLDAIEEARSATKSRLANHFARTAVEPGVVVKSPVRRFQCRPCLFEGHLTEIGLSLPATPGPDRKSVETMPSGWRPEASAARSALAFSGRCPREPSAGSGRRGLSSCPCRRHRRCRELSRRGAPVGAVTAVVGDPIATPVYV